MAIVGEGDRRRVYLPTTSVHVASGDRAQIDLRRGLPPTRATSKAKTMDARFSTSLHDPQSGSCDVQYLVVEARRCCLGR